jgi:hypothetical protein
MRPCGDEVAFPHVVPPLRPESDAAAFVQPEPAVTRRFHRLLQARPRQDAFHPLGVTFQPSFRSTP